MSSGRGLASATVNVRGDQATVTNALLKKIYPMLVRLRDIMHNPVTDEQWLAMQDVLDRIYASKDAE